jgi:multidrug efflux pump subunit AcrB
MWLTRFSIKNPTIVTLFFLAVGLFGTIGYMSMGQNIVPAVQEPKVYVSAYYSGASPEEMERLVVRPIEDQIQNVAHLDKVQAQAQDGAATITISFKVGTESVP